MIENGWDAYGRCAERANETAKHLGAMIGHIMNAKFALESGESKASAIRTLSAALDLHREYEKPMRDFKEQNQ